MTLSLKVFRAAYPTAFHDRVLKEGPKELTKKDIFYYVYGILHAPTYREKYKENLKKELPRIPLCTDFESYSRLGKALAELHLNYESKDIWPNLIVTTPNEADPDPVEKMKWARKYDPTVKKKSTIIHVSYITAPRSSQTSQKAPIAIRSTVRALWSG